MKKHEDIVKDLEVVLAEYRKSAETAPAPELRKLSDRIKQLREQMSDSISEGAKDCPGCGKRPHGMQRTVATLRTPEVWEIGCLGCPPKGGVRFCARGTTRDQAIYAWNTGKFVKVSS
jgi:uncharacterized coiled-coil protein SlyX